ncbi:hypothetical protein c7_R748 [Megavirus courdo7]|uniref:Uncharacterized protein n=1 Tax=Megavirus courdo7 TaxID=1128135 RepID=H2EBN8_9VIRU|nr:hypothetical protein c7_R748 [Megavirus courdo7]
MSDINGKTIIAGLSKYNAGI